MLELFSLQSPFQKLYDARIHDRLERWDAVLTLLLIGSYEPLAPLYVAAGPQHPDVVTVYFLRGTEQLC